MLNNNSMLTLQLVNYGIDSKVIPCRQRSCGNQKTMELSLNPNSSSTASF